MESISREFGFINWPPYCAFESLYGGQFTLPTQLIKPIYWALPGSQRKLGPSKIWLRDAWQEEAWQKINMAGLRNLFYLVLTAFSTLVLIIIVRTVMFSDQPTAAVPCKPSDLDFIQADDAVKKRFQTAITFQTVSYDVGIYSREELYKFLQFILKGKQRTFQRVSVCLLCWNCCTDGDKPRFARFEAYS